MWKLLSGVANPGRMGRYHFSTACNSSLNTSSFSRESVETKTELEGCLNECDYVSLSSFWHNNVITHQWCVYSLFNIPQMAKNKWISVALKQATVPYFHIFIF